MAGNAEIVKRGWEAVARGDWDALLADYVEDLIFVMPGQNDVLEGKPAVRNLLDNLASGLPPGFEITSIREIGNADDVVSVLNWTCDKIPNGSQLAVLFRFTAGKVYEERWFVDIEQWKAAF